MPLRPLKFNRVKIEFRIFTFLNVVYSGVPYVHELKNVTVFINMEVTCYLSESYRGKITRL